MPDGRGSVLPPEARGSVMGMRMGGGAEGWAAMRSFRRDQSITQQRLPKGIVRRVARFARPYRWQLAAFLLLIVVSSVATAANPLLLRGIIDQGIGHHRIGLVVLLASIVAALAVFGAGLSLLQRCISARIGEGLIYDMRSQVFAHVSRMPISFFTRTQTGALVSRLNNDVLGAQQAFTDTFQSVVGNLVGVAVTLGAMFLLSWPITLVSLALLPIFVVPARFVGRRLATLTRESYSLNAEMNNTMTERFNVSGALLVKLFGDPVAETSVFNSRAGRVRDIGVTTSMYGAIFMTALLLTASLATALVYGWGGVEAAKGRAARRDGRGAHRVPRKALRSAHCALERPGRRDDGARELRPGLRGARPPTDDRRAPRRRRHPVGAGRDRLRPRGLLVPDRRGGLARVARERGGARPGAHPAGALRRVVPGGARGDGGARRAVRCREDDHLAPRAPSLRREARSRADQRRRRARRHLGLRAPDRRGRHPGRPPVPRDDPLEPPLRQAVGPRGGAPPGPRGGPDPAARRLTPRRPRHRRRRPRLPAVGRREAAHRHRTAAPQGPGRRGPRRGDGPPRLRVRARRAGGAREGALGPHVDRHRPPALDGEGRRQDPRRRGGTHRGGGHARGAPRAWRPLCRALPDAVRGPGGRRPDIAGLRADLTSSADRLPSRGKRA